MVILFKIEKINFLKYKINKYITILLYFLKIIKTNFLIYICINCKLYLIISFKANILINIIY